MGGALIVIIGFLFSCQNEKDCHSKIKDERTLNEYFVRIDSCKIWKDYRYHEYFSGKGLAMSGFGDRLLKQGKWSFHYDGREIATGEFRDGRPIGDWKSDLVNIKNWKIIKGQGPVVEKMNVIRQQLDANPLNQILGKGTQFGIRKYYMSSELSRKSVNKRLDRVLSKISFSILNEKGRKKSASTNTQVITKKKRNNERDNANYFIDAYAILCYN